LAVASNYLLTSDVVEVSTVEVDSWDGITPAEADDNIYYVFKPKNKEPEAAFIILPGGNSAPAAYAPAAHQIAAEGFLTILLPMPDCVALPTGYMRADIIISAFADIKKWVIGGHSVGGVAACLYGKKKRVIDGVIIWASIPPNQLQNTDLKVLSIYGSEDGRCTPDMVTSYSKYLPADTTYVEIEGGNHTQFAYYNTVPDLYLEDDNPATITLEEQQTIIVNVTSVFIREMPDRPEQESACLAINLLGNGHLQLNTIRQFRDNVLEKYPAGRKLIVFYYENSPAIITILEKHPIVKKSAKKIFESIAPIIVKIVKE
jgi:hypothetical protein